MRKGGLVTKQAWKHFVSKCAAFGEAMNASRTVAQETGKPSWLKSGRSPARAWMMCAMLATLGLSVVSIGVRNAAAQNTGSQSKAKAQQTTKAAVQMPTALQRETWRKSM